MEPIYELALLVLAFSAGGGLARALRDAYKRRINPQELPGGGCAPVFDLYDMFFDVSLGSITGGAAYLAMAAVMEAPPEVDAVVAFMLVCAGYAGADLIDGILGKGLALIKTKLP